MQDIDTILLETLQRTIQIAWQSAPFSLGYHYRKKEL